MEDEGPANNPSVEVAPSTFRGRVTGPTIAAGAVLLADGEADIAAKALALSAASRGLLVPITHRLMGYQTKYYELAATTGGRNELP